MCGALNKFTVRVHKLVGLPLQFNAEMRAAISIGIEIARLIDDKQWGARDSELFAATHCDSLLGTESDVLIVCPVLISRGIAGHGYDLQGAGDWQTARPICCASCR